MAKFSKLPSFIQRDIKRAYEAGASNYYISKVLAHYGVSTTNIRHWAKQWGWKKSDKKLDLKEVDKIFSYVFVDLDLNQISKLLKEKSVIKRFGLLPDEKLNDKKFMKSLTPIELKHYLEEYKKRLKEKERDILKHKEEQIKEKKKNSRIMQRLNGANSSAPLSNPAVDYRAKKTTIDDKEVSKEIALKNIKGDIVASEEQLDEMIYKVVQALLMGSRKDSIQRLLKKNYLISLKKANEIIELARKEIVSSIETNTNYVLGFHREARLFLYNKMLKQEDFRGALVVLQDLARIDNIYIDDKIKLKDLEGLSDSNDEVIEVEIPEEYSEYFDNEEKDT